MKIAIINYGAGNLRSVSNALTALGRDFAIVDNPKKLSSFNKIILPGVGAAGPAMEKLTKRGFAKIIPKLKIPVLGVCLGMQLMADFSEEGNIKCLSIIHGRVKKFQTSLKVPHMGWNKVGLVKKSVLTRGIPDKSYFYFVHSYYLETDEPFIIGQTNYDSFFPAITKKNNFFGTQFHPEKSEKWGMKLLNNFCDLPAKILLGE